jgi:hypothetical protein
VFSVESVPRLYNADQLPLAYKNTYNVTSGGIMCSKGTPIIKKSSLLFFIKGGTTKEGEKTKVLTLNKYMAMGPSGARCQE